MKVCIVGAGSIGATLGAKLAASGHEVCLIARGAHLRAIRAHGLTLVDHVDGHGGTYRLAASDDPADFGTQDLVLIAQKAHAIAALLPRLQPLVGPATTVVPAINGLPWWYFYREGGPHDGMRIAALDPDNTMFAALDCRHVVGCVVHVAAEVRAPGEVHHTGGRRLILGEPDHSLSARLHAVCAALNGAGFEAEASPNIRLAVWTKLVGNTSFNPIAALTGYLMNQLCTDETVQQVIHPVMQEAMAVSAAYGYPLPMTVEQRVAMAAKLGAAKISMLQDLEQRRPLELAAIVGAVLELADLANIPVPTMRVVNALTLARARSLGLA